MKASKEIEINGKKVTIKKIAIGKFAELMLAVDKLPSIVTEIFTVEELQSLDTGSLMLKLPTLLGKSQDEIFKLVSVASGIGKVDELDPEEFFEVIETVLELNNINAIVSRVKNLGKVLQAKVK